MVGSQVLHRDLLIDFPPSFKQVDGGPLTHTFRPRVQLPR